MARVMVRIFDWIKTTAKGIGKKRKNYFIIRNYWVCDGIARICNTCLLRN
jgi:hypothetical protein